MGCDVWSSILSKQLHVALMARMMERFNHPQYIARLFAGNIQLLMIIYDLHKHLWPVSAIPGAVGGWERSHKPAVSHNAPTDLRTYDATLLRKTGVTERSRKM